MRWTTVSAPWRHLVYLWGCPSLSPAPGRLATQYLSAATGQLHKSFVSVCERVLVLPSDRWTKAAVSDSDGKIWPGNLRFSSKGLFLPMLWHQVTDFFYFLLSYFFSFVATFSQVKKSIVFISRTNTSANPMAALWSGSKYYSAALIARFITAFPRNSVRRW